MSIMSELSSQGSLQAPHALESPHSVSDGAPAVAPEPRWQVASQRLHRGHVAGSFFALCQGESPSEILAQQAAAAVLLEAQEGDKALSEEAKIEALRRAAELEQAKAQEAIRLARQEQAAAQEVLRRAEAEKAAAEEAKRQAEAMTIQALLGHAQAKDKAHIEALRCHWGLDAARRRRGSCRRTRPWRPR